MALLAVMLLYARAELRGLVVFRSFANPYLMHIVLTGKRMKNCTAIQRRYKSPLSLPTSLITYRLMGRSLLQYAATYSIVLQLTRIAKWTIVKDKYYSATIAIILLKYLIKSNRYTTPDNKILGSSTKREAVSVGKAIPEYN